MQNKIAIIGAGISGLGAAYTLDRFAEVTIYEKGDYLGGHARTIEVKTKQASVPVDTGFIVFNKPTYPLLTSLFEDLSIDVSPCSMSFGVSINDGELEYGSASLNSLFAQRKNMLKPSFYKMLKDILRFYKSARASLTNDDLSLDVSLGDYLERLKLGEDFRRYFLIPMGAAIWSTPCDKMYAFPAKTFLQFYNNHGLLSATGQPSWFSPVGGSQTYVKAIADRLSANIKINCAVSSIKRLPDGMILITDNDGHVALYNHVILACHSNQALSMLHDPSEQETSILSAIKYQKNHMVLHSDTRLMPRCKRAWSSWVYSSEDGSTGGDLSLSYWMNHLQKLNTEQPMIVSINPAQEPADWLKHDECLFEHPVFDAEAVRAQESLPQIQGVRNTWFAGAYWGYGFHEDGLRSAVSVCEKMGVKPTWARA